jgi:hypothetical protein
MNWFVRLKGRQVKDLFSRWRVRGRLFIAFPVVVLALALFATLAHSAPTHPFDESLSHEGAFTGPCGTATDPEGDL